MAPIILGTVLMDRYKLPWGTALGVLGLIGIGLRSPVLDGVSRPTVEARRASKTISAGPSRTDHVALGPGLAEREPPLLHPPAVPRRRLRRGLRLADRHLLPRARAGSTSPGPGGWRAFPSGAVPSEGLWGGGSTTARSP